MNRDDIIRMARESGFTLQRDERLFTEMLERFFHAAYAAGAAAERDKYEAKFKQLEAIMQAREQQPNKPCCLAEREACAKVCDDLNFVDNGTPAGTRASNRHCAAAIRARGQG